MIQAINTGRFIVEEIVWTMGKRSDIEPFLNEFFPERETTLNLAGHYTANGGTLYVSGRKIYYKERRNTSYNPVLEGHQDY